MIREIEKIKEIEKASAKESKKIFLVLLCKLK